MRRSVFRSSFVLIITALTLLAGCGGSGESTSIASTPAGTSAASTSTSSPAKTSTFPVTVKDSSGVEVRLEQRPERIVSLSPGSTEGLFAIGAGSQVVARDRFSDYPEQAKALPALEYTDPNPESILAHRPDLVILATRQKALVPTLRQLGMTVFFGAEPASLDEVYGRLEALGQLTGHEAEAQHVVTQMRAEIGAVTASIAGVERGPRVFYEVSADLYTAAPNTFIGSLLTLLKATNIAQGATTAFPQLTAEAVVAANPEVVLLTDARAGESLETVSKRPGWSGVAAVVDKRVYPINADLVNRPGPRLVEGMRAMADALYPTARRRSAKER